jgi:tetratricopeptide (TPR) repeat protein
MNQKIFWLTMIAVGISFAGGFFLANSLNRNEISQLRAELERLKKGDTETAPNQSQLSLSDEEIRQKIAQADNNPTDFVFQRNLGLGLYRYGAMKQDDGLLREVLRILMRVHENNPKDYDITVALGNAHFDIGFFKKENESFAAARRFYQKALEQKPADADVRTDLGLTYFLPEPPELEKAAAELQKSLEANPNHERALEFITQTLLRQNKFDEAEKYAGRLKAVNPNNPLLPELTTQIRERKVSEQK